MGRRRRAGSHPFVAGTTLLVSVWKRRLVYAGKAFVVGLAAVIGLATGLSPESPEHVGRVGTSNALLFLTGLVAPLAAILIAAGDR